MSAPAGVVVAIPLPPGMTLSQLEELHRQLYSIAITALVAFALICWDYLLLVRQEWRLYRTGGRKLWTAPVTYAFIVLRYSPFVATVPSLFYTLLQTKHCQTAVTVSEAGVVAVSLSSGFIFAYRVIAIWAGNKIVTGIVSVLYLMMATCWIAVAAQYRVSTGPPTSLFSNCQFEDLVSWAPISFFSSVVFDLVVFLLTLAKLKNQDLKDSPYGRRVYLDSLLYVAATVGVNLMVAIVEALPARYNPLKSNVVPFSTVITVRLSFSSRRSVAGADACVCGSQVAMSQRVYLHLKLFHARQPRVLDKLRGASQFTGSTGMTGSSFAEFSTYLPPYTNPSWVAQNDDWDDHVFIIGKPGS
ncbi:hypothetical protein PUNSTDRAFT_52234 [Punctularia strigosozonata HHB-11173 SS5]|uniref:uncharacterized protein n=1 Tax=Punctularia strigosozonata (strain HHB-11173) TaxID=741275 RepID=UPI0004416E3D|nr:uncharacterized protein PUNSTDRAFT_52234 [Punctularia strigosozonata HHB-11173 SS5]EIN08750.1 hypothetical protein PUNSTDRAFT_52234 [Punctularia strigosozonata HHB-11173 SS5]